MVRKNEHLGLAPNGSFQTGRHEIQDRRNLSLVRSNHHMISSMVAPASRFSNTVATGMRMPRNSHIVTNRALPSESSPLLQID